MEIVGFFPSKTTKLLSVIPHVYLCIEKYISRISRFVEEWVHFLRKAIWENIWLKTRGTVLPVGPGPQQCFVNDLSAVFFLPSLVVEDRQWIQSLCSPGLSWVVTIMPLCSLGRAAGLVVLWIPACPDIAILFSFSSTIPLGEKLLFSPWRRVLRKSRRHSQRWRMKEKIKDHWKASKSVTISLLFFELVAESVALMSRISFMLAFQKPRHIF